jgi:tryptophan synthase alpha chain
VNPIQSVFNNLKKHNKKALIPYIMAGDPSLKETEQLVYALEESGADLIELGVPFSDPLADGPTIQRASERALQNKVTLRDVLTLVSKVRQKSSIPLVVMTYCNLVFKYGQERFVKDAVNVGIDGIIIPDLIPDEAEQFIAFARNADLATIFLLAPTSNENRIKIVTQASTGFIYYVSLTGVTGAELTIDKALKNSIDAIKAVTDKPVAVGFGISNPDQAAQVARFCDGIIIGSAIVKLIAQGRDIRDFVRSIKEAL